MLHITEISKKECRAADTLTLAFDMRQKSRLLTLLDSGEEAALMLPPGTTLRGGDFLCATDGRVIEVKAQAERVITGYTQDYLTWARACYHLGNRHVPLQLGVGWLRFAYDHVLVRMISNMGLRVVDECAPFEPEAGAYAQHAARPVFTNPC
ncbi:MAG: urease accessory protein UreE [Pseudomonadota bacterium]|mgnify:CR=1 FL=1